MNAITQRTDSNLTAHVHLGPIISPCAGHEGCYDLPGLGYRGGQGPFLAPETGHVLDLPGGQHYDIRFGGPRHDVR